VSNKERLRQSHYIHGSRALASPFLFGRLWPKNLSLFDDTTRQYLLAILATAWSDAEEVFMRICLGMELGTQIMSISCINFNDFVAQSGLLNILFCTANKHLELKTLERVILSCHYQTLSPYNKVFVPLKSY
jgi:hypothetical protein